MSQIPLEITFRNLEHSDALETEVRARAARLERFSSDIIGCRVSIEAPHRHHYKGKVYRVRIDITVPGREIAATRNPDTDHSHEDIYVAVRDAFDSVTRMLEDYERRRRDKTRGRGSRRIARRLSE